jgi:hypothetical protein
MLSGVLLASLFLCGPTTARADDTEAMRRHAVNWFKAVNVGGPEGKMVPGVSRNIDEALKDGRDVTVLVPSRLSKSGKAFYGTTFAGVFFAFELTEDQARRAGFDPEGVITRQGPKRGSARQAQPLVHLDRLSIDNAARVSGDRSLTGSAVCHFFAEPRGELVVRITYKLKGSTVEITKPLRDLPQDGVLRLSIDAINRDNKDPHAGPLPLFVDVCSVSGTGFDRKLTVVSNTQSLLLDVIGTTTNTSTTNTVTSLVGTKWQFPGTKTTVEFLAGGRVHFKFESGDADGKWEQKGNKVTFDANGFTLFELEMKGNEMTGTWTRLKGEDVGKKYPSGLKRI